VGFQPEIFFAYPCLTVWETLTYLGGLSGLSGVQLRQRIPPLLERVGLAAARQTKVGALSKGMQQRLGLAQSILHAPRLVIWDEPTSGLDPQGRRQVLDLALELRAAGTTLLLSTHVLADVEPICDHLAMIAGGRVLLAGNSQELRAAGGHASLESLYFATMAGA
jgi:ABC-2 type transport system ATP-binding protein